LISRGRLASNGLTSGVDSPGQARAGFGPTAAETRAASQKRRNWQRRGQMNKLELVEHIAKEADLTKVSAAAALEAALDGVAKSLKKGEEVRLVGFGTFSVRERAAGKGRNPATGKEIKIAASKNARFKAGAALKGALNKKAPVKK
jgi:DNA-binding protein HU-beta